MLHEVISQLYHARGNRMLCSKLEGIDQEKLQEILDTPSKHQNLIRGTNNSSAGYLTVELTSLWIHYFKNWYKFDKEIQASQISIHHNSWNIAIWNNIQQEININEEIDKILSLLESKNISNKEEIKLLLEELKEEENEKKKKIKLNKILWILGDMSSVGQLLIAILHLLWN